LASVPIGPVGTLGAVKIVAIAVAMLPVAIVNYRYLRMAAPVALAGIWFVAIAWNVFVIVSVGL
jgi:hypothetical protein